MARFCGFLGGPEASSDGTFILKTIRRHPEKRNTETVFPLLGAVGTFLHDKKYTLIPHPSSPESWQPKAFCGATGAPDTWQQLAGNLVHVGNHQQQSLTSNTFTS